MYKTLNRMDALRMKYDNKKPPNAPRTYCMKVSPIGIVKSNILDKLVFLPSQPGCVPQSSQLS